MTSYGSTRSTPPSVLALLPLLLFLLLLLLGAPHGAYSAADAPPHRVRLRDVHLGDGDALAFRLEYLGSALSSSNASYLEAVRCHWALASRADENVPFAALRAPTVVQLARGVLADGVSAAMAGSFTAFDKSVAATGSSSDYGDVIFAAACGSDRKLWTIWEAG